MIDKLAKNELDIYKSRCESLSFESGLLQCANKQLQAKLDEANNVRKEVQESIAELQRRMLTARNQHLAELGTAKEKNNRLRDKIQAARQWQTCPACSRIFATQS